jgi:hypothetical protein
MSEDGNQTRFARLTALRAEIGEQLGLPVDNTRVLVASALRLAHEGLTARMIAGREIDVASLLRIGDLLLETAPPPPVPKRVTVEFCGTIDLCPVCNYQRPARDDGRRDGPSAARALPVIEAEATEVVGDVPTTTDAKSAEVKAAEAKDPVPAPPKQSAKWQGSGDHAFMPATNFTAGVPGFLKKPSPWPGRGTSAPMFGGVKR